MATDVDTLVRQATFRTDGYAANTIFLVNELRTFINDKKLNIDTGDPLDLSSIGLPSYTAPSADGVPMPVYEPPSTSLPTAPVLADVGTITLPGPRTEPTLNTTGLFAYPAPNTNLPDFQETDPDLGVDDLIAEMNALTEPVLTDLQIPNLSPLTLSTRPTLDLPTFIDLPPPDEPGDPADYAARFASEYASMAPEMQNFINDKVSTWVSSYCPEYSTWNTILKDVVEDGMTGTVLPDQIEAAMYTRARTRVQQEFQKVDNDLASEYAKFGRVDPPGRYLSAVRKAKLVNANALATQSTDIYIDRKKMELQHLQFSINAALGSNGSVRQMAVTFANHVGSTLQQSASYANVITDKFAKIYDHLIARAQLRVAIMNALNEQYGAKLKAALSALEGYRLELDAARLQKDVELAALQAIETSIKMEELKIDKYSKMLDAIVKKGEVEKLKLVSYQTRADVFKTNTQAKVAAWDVYKAALDGDKSKLDGEMAKLKLFESQLNSDNIKLDAQMKAISATVAANDAKSKVFQIGGEVYKLDLDSAIKKFTAYAEVKKLAQSVRAQELNNAIQVFTANIEIPKILMNAMVQEYTLRVETALKEATLEIEKLKISEQASAQAVDALKTMAAAALGSLNTMVSSALSATA